MSKSFEGRHVPQHPACVKIQSKSTLPNPRTSNCKSALEKYTQCRVAIWSGKKEPTKTQQHTSSSVLSLANAKSSCGFKIRRPRSACPVFLACVGPKMCSKLQNPQSKFQDSKFKIQILDQGGFKCYINVQNPKSKTQNLNSKIQNPGQREPRKKNRDITVQNPKCKIRPKSLGFRFWVGKIKILDPCFGGVSDGGSGSEARTLLVLTASLDFSLAWHILTLAEG